MNLINITARDLPDAWFQCLYNILDHGRIYTIDRGSFEGQQRMEFDYVTVHVKHPGIRPLLPDVPTHLGLPAPVTDDYLDSYMPYLMTSAKQPGETYTYGQYLEKQIAEVIRMFKEDGYGTNQACMTTCDPDMIYMKDPACLRLIDCRIKDEKLNFITYFRCIGANEKLLYQDNEKICFDTLKSLHESFQNNHNIKVVSLNYLTKSPIWTNVTKTKIRIADDIKQYQAYGELPLSITDDHWLFTEPFPEAIKQAKNLYTKTNNIIRFNSIDMLDNMQTQHQIDLFELFKNENKYYICNLSYNLAQQFKHSTHKSSKKSLFSVPINKINDFSLLPLNVKIRGVNSSKSYDRFINLTEDFGYICGAWLANGWFKKSGLIIAIGISRIEVVEKLHQSLKNCNINFISYMQGRALITFIGDKLLHDLLIKIGFVHGAHTKAVPNFVFNSNYHFKRGFFDGWIEGDGGGSVSQSLTEGMRVIGCQIGEFTSINLQKSRTATFPDGHKAISSKYYSIYSITGQRHSFSKLIRTPKIKKISQIYTSGEVVDIQVDQYDNFCIGSGFIIVHNSWDLWGGMPANLAAIQLLKEYMAAEIGVKDGEIIASSKGLHLYDYAWPLAKLRTMRD
jgi:thymidylate synthase